VYRDLHAHPEASFAEHRTAGVVADRLRALGYETTPGVGGTGVVGVLRNGTGPVALLRADMDALPVQERTGLPYASTATTRDPEGGTVPLMHACGHDVHVTCLLGAAAVLAGDRGSWQGTAVLVFQPAEEVGRGALAMLEDGLLERFGTPDVVLGQHVAPLPAGVLGLRPGPAFAASDALRVVLHGRGAHGSRPETSVDPVLMAAATVVRLQGIVSREVAGTETAVVTVGALHAGTRPNVIPDRAELLLTVRSYDTRVRDRVLAAIERIVRAEAAASGAPREPEVQPLESFPTVVNDPDAAERTRRGFEAGMEGALVVDPGPVTGSEDVGRLATAAGAPLVYWLLGGADPAAFAGAASLEDVAEVVRGLPSNHAPDFAPVVDPTLRTGVAALVSAARTWLPAG
jgi:hippurate hydrolase